MSPPVGRLFGKMDFSGLFINLSGTHYGSLADARQASAAVIAYWAFINTAINFVIIALVLFLVIKVVNRMTAIAKPKCEPAVNPVIRDCPFCFSKMDVKATRGPQCTSQLP